jgi:hypothetical protein
MLAFALQTNRTDKDRGNILIQGCWEHCTDCIIDVCITDVTAKLNRSRSPGKVLAQHEKGKRKRNTSSPALSNVNTLHLLLFPQMASLARKPKCYSSSSWFSFWRNGRNLTLRYVAMSMLKSALPLFEPLTSVCGDLIFQQAT